MLKLFLTIVLAVITVATFSQFVRLARPLFRFAFWATVLFAWWYL